MRKLKFVDYPIKIDKLAYDDLKEKVVLALKSISEVKSIYQMGSVKEPGISDLDIICVFEKNSQCDYNIRNNLSDAERKILTHSLFGIECDQFNLALEYNFISNLNLLDGDELIDTKYLFPHNSIIKSQIALEYILRLFMSLTEQISIGIVKVRSFLLLAKAIKFDLELLGIKEGELNFLVEDVLNYRAYWFERKPTHEELEKLIFSFYSSLEELLEEKLTNNIFYLPHSLINLPEGYVIKQSDIFQKIHRGFSLPSNFYFLGKRYINFQRKFNNFEYRLPYKIPEKDSEIYGRFAFGRNLHEINRENYRNFIALNSSLSIF